MKIHTLCILATISLSHQMYGMEGKPNTSQSQLTLPQILSSACARTKPLNLEQKKIYEAAIDQTLQFNVLVTTDVPAQLKMNTQAIMDITSQASDVFTSQYKETWAPRTFIGALGCCVASVAKKICPGIIDVVPTEDATVFLTGAWVAQVLERQPHRQSIENGSTVLTMIQHKNETITKQRIAAITQRHQALREMKERLEGNSNQVTQETLNTNTVEDKKNQ